MSDNENLIKKCESEIESLQQILNDMDSLDLTVLDADTRDSVININKKVEQSCYDKINYFNQLICELKQSNGDTNV